MYQSKSQKDMGSEIAVYQSNIQKDIDLSGPRVRLGMKRELKSMLRTLEELGELPRTRKRVARHQNLGDYCTDNVSDARQRKKRTVPRARNERKGLGDMAHDDVVTLPGSDVVQESVRANTNATERAPIVHDSDIGFSNSDCYIPVFAEPSFVESFSIDSLTDIQKQMMEDDQALFGDECLPDMLASHFNGSDMEMGTKSGVLNDGIVDNMANIQEVKMNGSVGIEFKKVPQRLKDLLKTHLLEGLRVRYIHRLEGKKLELVGVIHGTQVLCWCDQCRGKMAVTPNQFELHAHSRNKRPSEYMYLDNGKSLRDILNACINTPLDSLEALITDAIGRSDVTTALCLHCKAMTSQAGCGASMLCHSCFGSAFPGPSSSRICDHGHTSPLEGSFVQVSSSTPEVAETVQIGSCAVPRTKSQGKLTSKSPLEGSFVQVSSPTPEVAETVQIGSCAVPRTKSQGKLTSKDMSAHKSVFSEDVLPDGSELAYVIRGKKIKEGSKTGGGIECKCCQEVMSPSKFEAHAGYEKRRNPYRSICKSNGVSLLVLQLELSISKMRKPCHRGSDSLCSICQEGGDLLCCETCTRAFHHECVGFQSCPGRKWCCSDCQNNKRCIHTVEPIESDGGGCVICRLHEYKDDKSEVHDQTLIVCHQCEEHHIGCLRERNICDLKVVPSNEWFCSTNCGNIYDALQKLIKQGENKLPEALLGFRRRNYEVKGFHQNLNLNVSWRLLKGANASEETSMWLSSAVRIFHDQFDPIIFPSNRRVDLVPPMVYGRKLKKHNLNFSNIYCAVLMVGSVVVCAAILRIFGEEVAELPLIATKSDCQKKGYFKSLYYCIENLLSSLNVKDLVLPAAADAESLWTNRFGFSKIDQLKQYENQIMFFAGTSVLHKSISHT